MAAKKKSKRIKIIKGEPAETTEVMASAIVEIGRAVRAIDEGREVEK